MSDLQPAGVKLIAQDQAAFLQALAASDAAVATLGVSAASSAKQIDTLTTRISFQERTLGVLTQELAATSAKYGEGSTQAARKQIAVDKLTASIAKDEAALAQLRAQETAATQSSGQLGGALDKAGQSSSKFGDVMTGALRRVGEIAVNALGSAAQALGSFVASSIKGAGDYEQSMNVLAATTGATDEQMRAVKDTAKALGADLTLPATSAASAGDAMLYLTQQGLSLDDALAGAKGTLQLAAAGMIDEKTAAETAATALNQFHLAGSEATRVADLLAASVSASGSSVGQTGQAIQQAGTSFASAGVPLEEFIALVNEMSKAGLKGSDAGTSLKTMMQRLEAPTDKAAKAMQALGISVYDQSGTMRPMREIIGQFSESLSGLTQQQRDAAVVTIFGSDAQRAANIVLKGGVDAYDQMLAAVTRQGAAADLASARMQGLNGAVAGLGSQVETLALEALEPLLPLMTGVVTRAAELAGSFVGQVGPAITDVIGFLTAAGQVINDTAIPALSGLTAALITYAAVQAVQVLPAVVALIPQVVAGTAAFAAQAVAVAAAVAPYALIVAAIAGVVYAYQNLQQKTAAATDQLLAQKQFWTDAGLALDRYGEQSGEAATQLQPLADNIVFMRDLIRGEVDDLGKREVAYQGMLDLYNKVGVASGITADQLAAYRADLDADLATINQHAAGLEVATKAYDDQEQAILKAQAATMTATAQANAQTSALGENTEAMQLSEKELEELAKQLEKTYKDGTQAVQDYVTQAADFMKQLEQANREGGEQISADQAQAYAEQAAAQRAHLGQLLADYVTAQRQLHNMTDEQAQIALDAIGRQFGAADTTAARTFSSMEQAIDQFAQSGGQSADQLSEHLGRITDTAITTQEHMDALAKQYTLEIKEDFDKHRITAQEYREELEKIPERVTSEVVITERRVIQEEYRQGEREGRAMGGPVTRGVSYTVGERGQETFVPDQNGYIIPHRTSPPASPQQIISMPPPQVIIVQPASTSTSTTTINNNQAQRGLGFGHLAALYGGRG